MISIGGHQNHVHLSITWWARRSTQSWQHIFGTPMPTSLVFFWKLMFEVCIFNLPQCILCGRHGYIQDLSHQLLHCWWWCIFWDKWHKILPLPFVLGFVASSLFLWCTFIFIPPPGLRTAICVYCDRAWSLSSTGFRVSPCWKLEALRLLWWVLVPM